MVEIIHELTGIERQEVYFDDIDNKWHIEGSLKWFDTKAEAEKEAEAIYVLRLFARLAETVGTDYSYNGKELIIRF